MVDIVLKVNIDILVVMVDKGTRAYMNDSEKYILVLLGATAVSSHMLILAIYF